MSLFDEGRAEVKPTSTCSVCKFIADKPETAPEGGHSRAEWEAYINSDERATIVFRVMKKYGFAIATDGPIRNHRAGHGS